MIILWEKMYCDPANLLNLLSLEFHVLLGFLFFLAGSLLFLDFSILFRLTRRRYFQWPMANIVAARMVRWFEL